MRLFGILAVLLMVTASSAAPARPTPATLKPSQAAHDFKPSPSPYRLTPFVGTSAVPDEAPSGKWRRTAVNSGDTTISDLVMLADGTVYAVGHVEGGSLYFYELLLQRWDGSSWRQEAGPPFPAYYGSRISGTSADDLWIIRPETGQTLVSHRKGGVWSTTDLSKTVWNFMPLDLDVPAPGRPWLVGCYGHSDHYSGCSSKVLEFRGGAWQPHDVPLEAQSLTHRTKPFGNVAGRT